MEDSTKKVLRGILTGTIVVSSAAKEGLNFSIGICKVFLGGAENLANQMVGKGFNLGIGTFLLDKTEKAINWGFNKLIQLQKNIKGTLR